MTPARPHARTRPPRRFASRPVTTGPVASGAPTSRWRTTSRLLAVVAATFASALLVGVAPASAHDQLVGSQPADGETVTVAPEAIVLSFSADVADLSTEVVLRGPSGDLSIDTDSGVVVEGTTVTAPLPAGLPDGAYTVAWRVVSGDGHPIQGQLAFTIATPEPAPAVTPSPSASEPSVPDPAATATADAPVDEPSASPDLSSAPSDGTAPGSSAALGWGVALGAVALVGTAIAVVARRRRDQV